MYASYAAFIHKDGDDYVVSVRDLPEVVTAGDTFEEALTLAEDAIEVVVASRMERDLPLPTPSPAIAGEYVVQLPAQLAAKAAVYFAWKESGISKSELARRIGRTETEARRILTPRHGTKLEQLDAAAHALGSRLIVGVQAA